MKMRLFVVSIGNKGYRISCNQAASIMHCGSRILKDDGRFHVMESGGGSYRIENCSIGAQGLEAKSNPVRR
ncbi:MAG TPA: hypothetical protein VKM94_17970 [Blastocatellia bacterium]|nr:hypothetical protein [Blastocatellia bacterium]